jgi:hypothetical protein
MPPKNKDYIGRGGRQLKDGNKRGREGKDLERRLTTSI